MDTWIGEECDIRPKKNRGAMPSQNEILKKIPRRLWLPSAALKRN